MIATSVQTSVARGFTDGRVTCSNSWTSPPVIDAVETFPVGKIPLRTPGI